MCTVLIFSYTVLALYLVVAKNSSSNERQKEIASDGQPKPIFGQQRRRNGVHPHISCWHHGRRKPVYICAPCLSAPLSRPNVTETLLKIPGYSSGYDRYISCFAKKMV